MTHNGKNLIINAHGDTLYPVPPPNNGEFSDGQLAVMSALVARRNLGAFLGYTHGTDRDVYTALGYNFNPVVKEYLALYKRQDIANRIVKLPAVDTWRKPPLIIDGESRTDEEQPKSGFIQDIKTLVESKKLWHTLGRIDRLSGIGRFGLLLIGVKDGSSLEEPIEKKLTGPEGLAYFTTFSEASVMDNLASNLEKDPTNERFALPTHYDINFGDGIGNKEVHWSRVLHVAEGLLEDDIYGEPRLESVLNRLVDLEKIIGGGAEATWINMRRGIHIDIERDAKLSEAEEARLSDELDEYFNNIRRNIRTRNAKINELGSDVVDPTGLFKAIISLIAGAKNIPQRILIGSERGELASTQDLAVWYSSVAARQLQHAEPNILRPLIQRFIDIGLVRPPDGGRYSVEWASLFELSEIEQAEVAEKNAKALQTVAPAGAPELIIDGREFVKRFIPGLPVLEDAPEPVEMPPEADDDDPAANETALVLQHKASGVFPRSCPNCNHFGLDEYADHGGVLVCPGCERAFDLVEFM